VVKPFKYIRAEIEVDDMVSQVVAWMVAKGIGILCGGLCAAQMRRSKSEMMLPRITCPVVCLKNIVVRGCMPFSA
jgi:hypothetical protein